MFLKYLPHALENLDFSKKFIIFQPHLSHRCFSLKYILTKKRVFLQAVILARIKGHPASLVRMDRRYLSALLYLTEPISSNAAITRDADCSLLPASSWYTT